MTKTVIIDSRMAIMDSQGMAGRAVIMGRMDTQVMGKRRKNTEN